MGRSTRIFLKSALRRPARSILLLLLVAAAAFAFTVPVQQCALVLRETGQVGDAARAIGQVSAAADYPDWEGATEYLERSPYVLRVGKRWMTSGVLPEGVYNDDTDGYPSYGSRQESNYPAGCPNDILFYGTVRSAAEDGAESAARVRVDRVVTGSPGYLEPGKELEIRFAPEHRAAAEGLAPGGRYLLRATYDRDTCYDGGAMEKYLFVPLTEGGEPTLEAPQDLDLTAPEYYDLAFEIRMIGENQRSVAVLALTDMSAYPDIVGPRRACRLREGRFLTAEDTAEDRPVCVIRDTLADLRGYRLGDTITLKLRNIFPLLKGYLDNPIDVAGYDVLPTEEVTLEIVGIAEVDASSALRVNCSAVFVPHSAIPELFQPRIHLTSSLYDEQIAHSFELRDPGDTQAFLAEAVERLGNLGLEVTMLENNWEELEPLSRAMGAAARRNAILAAAFLAVAAVVLGVVCFRLRRRETALARALGIPASDCVAGASLPPILLGAVGAALGGGLGAWYVSAHAGALLADLAQLQAGVRTAAPVGWAVLAALIVFLLTAAAIFVAGFAAARRAPLAALQQKPKSGR